MFLLFHQKPHIKSVKTNGIFLKTGQVRIWSIVYIEGSKIIFFLKKCLFVSVQTLMKCHIMWHFIWVSELPVLWFLVKKKHAKFYKYFLGLPDMPDMFL